MSRGWLTRVLLAVAIAAATGIHDARAQDVCTHNCLPTPTPTPPPAPTVTNSLLQSAFL
jgi:hypothetical protein